MPQLSDTPGPAAELPPLPAPPTIAARCEAALAVHKRLSQPGNQLLRPPIGGNTGEAATEKAELLLDTARRLGYEPWASPAHDLLRARFDHFRQLSSLSREQDAADLIDFLAALDRELAALAAAGTPGLISPSSIPAQARVHLNQNFCVKLAWLPAGGPLEGVMSPAELLSGELLVCGPLIGAGSKWTPRPYYETDAAVKLTLLLRGRELEVIRLDNERRSRTWDVPQPA